jgi:acylphosphatase
VIRTGVVVSGRVQGVFFRDGCRQAAQRHQVAGWFTNRDDESVEAVFEGDDTAVGAMIEWVRNGRPLAQVTDVEVTDERPEGLTDFSVRSEARPNLAAERTSSTSPGPSSGSTDGMP